MTDTTLLSYAILPSPNPLQAGKANASFQLVVNNRTHEFVNCEKIVVTIPVGTNADSLTSDGTGIQSARPANWSVTNENGVLTCTPTTAEAKRIGGAGLTFAFSAINVNAEVGLCTVDIDETAFFDGETKRERSAEIPLPKFPAEFTVSDLSVDPLNIRAGESATLRWTGTAFTGAIYKLSYQAADDAPPTVVTVGNSGPYTAADLTRTNAVFFTLSVSVPVPGSDQPVTVTRQTSVGVVNLTLNFSVTPPKVGVNGVALLQWRTTSATSCVLDPGGETLASSGSRYVIVPQTTLFTVTARSAIDIKQEQKTVEVDPTIVGTLPGYTVEGKPGHPGERGKPYSSPGGFFDGRGDNGGRGDDAKLIRKVPPLDSSSRPARVIPITLKGGSGGPGGDGCFPQWDERYPMNPGGDGGNGGDGGDAILDLTFDPSEGQAAQYLVRLVAGSGGAEGKTTAVYGGMNGLPGHGGSIKTAFRPAALLKAANEPLLSYSILSSPNPLEANTPGALTVVISNSTGDFVICERIVFTLPAGTNAKDLIVDGTGIESARPRGWNVQNDNGVLTCTPDTAAGKIGGEGLTFTFSRLRVNAQFGTSRLDIDEKASTASDPKQERSTSIAVPKFPAQFTVSDLRAEKSEVASGGKAVLDWNATALSRATYTIDYQPNDEGRGVTATVGNNGPYTSVELTRTGSVTFTLTVTIPVPGQDTPLVRQKQFTVAVKTLALELTVLPTTVGVNGLALLQWKAVNASSCMLDPGGETVPTSGSRYVIVTQSTNFTITASGLGKVKQEQKRIEVNPAIVPNIVGHNIVGSNGGPGSPGRNDPTRPGRAGSGGNGGDASLSGKLPPFETSSSPVRVMPITLTGGDGGPGGQGGSDSSFNPQRRGASGGDGGKGGNVTLDATFDPTAGSSAQFIVIMKAGKGGPGGPGGGGSDVGPNGSKGRDGTVTLKPR